VTRLDRIWTSIGLVSPNLSAVKPLTALRRRVTERDKPAKAIESWRPRAALAAVVAACVGVTAIAVTGAGNATPGLKFVQSGHWIYNSTVGSLFHIDGGTKNVNAEVPLPGAGPDTVVVQTDKSGYVLAPGRSFEFGKSDLKVADPLLQPAELPVGLEAAGVAFAVFRQAGRIVRFGEHPLTEPVGGTLGEPVVSPTGTLWVHRQDTGQLCQLPVQADRLTCLAKVSVGHTGALTMVGDLAVFVDTTARAMRAVSSEGLGRTVSLAGLDITATSVIAPNDVAGRVAILNPDSNELHLVDAAQLISDKPARGAITKKLRPGRYERVASSGSGIALIDEKTDTLVTLDRDGEQKDLRKIPPPSSGAKRGPDARTRLFRGADSRLYVDSLAGEHVMVVDEGGDVTPVEAVGPKRGADKPGDDTSITPPPEPEPSITPTPTVTTKRPTEQPTPNRPTEESRPPDPPQTTRPTNDPEPTDNPKPDPAKPSPPKATVQAGRPGAPGSVVGRAGDGSVAVSWRAAAANGATISQYAVTWAGGSRTLPASARSVTVSGLQNGSGYTFTVRAVNRVGNGPGVNTARLYPGAAAEAPQGLNPGATAGRITLGWQRPDLNGGNLVHYQVDLAGGGSSSSKNVAGTATSWSGLTNGTRYQLTVRAITRTPEGKLLTGRPATTSATPVAAPAPRPTLTVARGADTTYSNCNPGDCAFILIRATGLQPDTDYTFKPYTSGWGNFNKGATLRTDSDGSIVVDDRFPCDAVGQQVWVTATGPGGTVTSAKITWPAG
jgi:hypothetical protein